MINIDFPSDPSKLQFHLAHNIAATYLVAKAAKHYGPRNINVVFLSLASPFLTIASDERMKSIYQIIDMVGLSDVSLIHTTEYTKHKSHEEVMTAGINFIRHVDPAARQAEVDGNSVEVITQAIRNKLDSIMVEFAVTIGVELGYLDTDLNIIPDAEPKTMVGIADASHNISDWFGSADAAPRILFDVWNPLEQYTDSEIIESAAEEGLLDVLIATRTCMHSRPLHCGVCDECVLRRMAFINSDVEDTTIYEYR